MKVTIKYITEIPSEAVTYSVLGYGGSFNGGVKSTLVAEIDLSKNGVSALKVKQRSWGETKEYSDDDAQVVLGKPDWYRKLISGASVLERATLGVSNDNLRASWEVPAGASHGVRLYVAGVNPLLSLAPAIDGEIVIGLKTENGKMQYMLSGDQDGFPNHIITINGIMVHKHDCITAEKTPGDLAPPSEVDVSTSWRELKK